MGRRFHQGHRGKCWLCMACSVTDLARACGTVGSSELRCLEHDFTAILVLFLKIFTGTAGSLDDRRTTTVCFRVSQKWLSLPLAVHPETGSHCLPQGDKHSPPPGPGDRPRPHGAYSTAHRGANERGYLKNHQTLQNEHPLGICCRRTAVPTAIPNSASDLGVTSKIRVNDLRHS